MIDAAAAEVRIQYRKRMSPEETSARVSIEQILSGFLNTASLKAAEPEPPPSLPPFLTEHRRRRSRNEAAWPAACALCCYRTNTAAQEGKKETIKSSANPAPDGRSKDQLAFSLSLTIFLFLSDQMIFAKGEQISIPRPTQKHSPLLSLFLES